MKASYSNSSSAHLIPHILTGKLTLRDIPDSQIFNRLNNFTSAALSQYCSPMSKIAQQISSLKQTYIHYWVPIYLHQNWDICVLCLSLINVWRRNYSVPESNCSQLPSAYFSQPKVQLILTKRSKIIERSKESKESKHVSLTDCVKLGMTQFFCRSSIGIGELAEIGNLSESLGFNCCAWIKSKFVCNNVYFIKHWWLVASRVSNFAFLHHVFNFIHKISALYCLESIWTSERPTISCLSTCSACIFTTAGQRNNQLHEKRAQSGTPEEYKWLMIISG